MSVIIECAINGATSKATNPNVPTEPAEIARRAVHFGATIGSEHLIPLTEAGLQLGLVDPAGRLPRGAMFKLYFSTERGYPGAPSGFHPRRRRSTPNVVASDIAGIALERRGHLQLGLEFFGGDRTPTNAELVAEVEAAEILGLPRSR